MFYFKDENLEKQKEYQHKIQKAGFNVVSCSNCDSVFFHDVGEEKLTCPYCYESGEASNFSDLCY